MLLYEMEVILHSDYKYFCAYDVIVSVIIKFSLMKEKLFFLCLVLFLSLPVAAQTNAARSFTIKGQVVDSLTNETVPYATLRIALANAPAQPVKLLASDDNGKFETTLTAPGQYLLFSQFVGKISTPRPFTVAETDKTVELGKVNMTDDTKQLGEVTVSAQKPLVKIEIDKITYSLEDDPEAKTNNTLEMLRKVPMVTVDGEDKIQLKGSTNYKIYMNGKPSNLLSNNPSDVLKSMPASSVKNIEVITDPGAKYDAEGIGGIINIITVSNAMQGYTGTVRANANTMGFYGGNVYLSSKIGKLGLTAMYNYNYRDMAWNDSYLDRENLINGKEKYMSQNGRSKYSGPFQYGYLEASYEIDTLNLINVGANLFNGKSKNQSEYDVSMLDSIMNPVYNYDRNSSTNSTFGSTDINVDFQHSTSKKDELLTVSYRYSHSPNGNKTYTDIDNVVNYIPYTTYPEKTNNDAWTDEHTGQVDYTNPIFKNQTLEVGGKYIFRQSVSETERLNYIDSLNTWKSRIDNGDFQHTQHIYSAYLGYVLKFTKYSFKAGVRAEGTALNVEYKRTPELNFSNNVFDIVPNATVSYQLSMASQMRLGYNMRIQRPGIWYLNPYINNVDPQNISYGNPDLVSEKSHNMNFNYSMFTQKFNFNASLSYTFVDNSIQSYTFINPDLPNVTQRTYGNIGNEQRTGMFVYGSWNPVPWFRFNLNGGLNYTDIKANDEYDMKASGWQGNVFAGAQFNLPKDFRINANGGYYSPWIMLQGKQSSMYFTGFSASKDFLKKKLTVQVGFQEPFRKDRKYEMTTTTPSFINHTIGYNTARSLSVSVSYRFGTLKEQIKKVRRGISNDDAKGGGGGSEGGGQSGGGGQ